MHLDTQIDSRLGGDPGTEMPLWSVRDHATPEYVRNVDNWLADVDLTCHSVWQSRDDVNQRCGTLITPDAFIASWHYRNTVGDTFRFVGDDGTIHTRTMTARKGVGLYIPPNDETRYDLYVGLLDSDLPSSITPARLLPTNFIDYVQGIIDDPLKPQFRRNLRLTAASLDQEDHACVRLADDFLQNLSATNVWFVPPSDSLLVQYYEPFVDGDSSDPTFLIINGEIVLMMTSVRGGAGMGVGIYSVLDAVEDALVDMGSAHTVTIADLSKFRTY